MTSPCTPDAWTCRNWLHCVLFLFPWFPEQQGWSTFRSLPPARSLDVTAVPQREVGVGVPIARWTDWPCGGAVLPPRARWSWGPCPGSSVSPRRPTWPAWTPPFPEGPLPEEDDRPASSRSSAEPQNGVWPRGEHGVRVGLPHGAQLQACGPRSANGTIAGAAWEAAGGGMAGKQRPCVHSAVT